MGGMLEYHQTERADAPVKFPQRGDSDGYENETLGDSPDEEPPEKSRLRPGIGCPGGLKEIRLMGRLPYKSGD